MGKKGVLLTHLFCQVFNNLINVSSIFSPQKKKINKKYGANIHAVSRALSLSISRTPEFISPLSFFSSPLPIPSFCPWKPFCTENYCYNGNRKPLNEVLSILWFIRKSPCLWIKLLTKWWLHYGQSEMWVTCATHCQNFWSPLEIPTLSWIHFVLRGCWFKCWMIHCLLLSPAVWA